MPFFRRRKPTATIPTRATIDSLTILTWIEMQAARYRAAGLIERAELLEFEGMELYMQPTFNALPFLNIQELRQQCRDIQNEDAQRERRAAAEYAATWRRPANHAR